MVRIRLNRQHVTFWVELSNMTEQKQSSHTNTKWYRFRCLYITICLKIAFYKTTNPNTPTNRLQTKQRTNKAKQELNYASTPQFMLTSLKKRRVFHKRQRNVKERTLKSRRALNALKSEHNEPRIHICIRNAQFLAAAASEETTFCGELEWKRLAAKTAFTVTLARFM